MGEDVAVAVPPIVGPSPLHSELIAAADKSARQAREARHARQANIQFRECTLSQPISLFSHVVPFALVYTTKFISFFSTYTIFFGSLPCSHSAICARASPSTCSRVASAPTSSLARNFPFTWIGMVNRSLTVRARIKDRPRLLRNARLVTQHFPQFFRQMRGEGCQDQDERFK